MEDTERRDVLATIAGVVGLPAVPANRGDIDEETGEELPDVGDHDPFWILLYWASNKSSVEEVENEWLPILAVFANRGMDDDDLWGYLRAAVDGEYDDEMLEERASDAWSRHD